MENAVILILYTMFPYRLYEKKEHILGFVLSIQLYSICHIQASNSYKKLGKDIFFIFVMLPFPLTTVKRCSDI